MAVLRWATGTHEGQVREINEDAAYANPHLFVVADGMGGHLAGEVASSMAIETLEAELEVSGENSLDDLVAAISLANQRIFSDATDNPEHAGMGTTVTAIAVITDRFDGEALGIANVGDSRIYLFRHDRLRQVTIDHSFVQELIAEGAISASDARQHPRRNIVTRGLGIEASVRVDSWTLPLIRGDRFVLCSDGLSDYVVEEDVSEVLVAHRDDPAAAVVELINRANAAGGPDNITVVIVDVLEGEDPPDPTEEIDVVPEWFDDDLDDTEDTLIIADPLPYDMDDLGADEGDTDELSLSEIGGYVPPVPVGESNPNGSAEHALDPPPSGASPIGHAGDDYSDVDGRQDGDTHSTDAGEAKSSSKKNDKHPRQHKPKKQKVSTTSRKNRVLQLVLLIGLAALLVGGFAVLGGWARGGYYVAFDEAGVVTVYKGRKGGFLWFEPTVATTGEWTRATLDQESIEKVEEEPTFATLANAQRFIVDQLSPKPELLERESEVEWPDPVTSPTTDPPTTGPPTNPSTADTAATSTSGGSGG